VLRTACRLAKKTTCHRYARLPEASVPSFLFFPDILFPPPGSLMSFVQHTTSASSHHTAPWARAGALTLAAVVASTSLTGCFTRQMWAPSYQPDPTHAVEVPALGRYVPEQETERGAGGTALRVVATPFTIAGDAGVSFVLFFADLAGLSYGAGDWMTRVPKRDGVTSPTSTQFANLPSWFLGFVNVPLVDETGRQLTFTATTEQDPVFSSGLIASVQGLSVGSHPYQGQPIVITGYGASIPSAGESSAVVHLSIEPVAGGLAISGTYRGSSDRAMTEKQLSRGVFKPKKP
jgi:hypothetical protein